jgi:acetyl-CoA carboxylase biotin carboxyl carrier protein
MAERDPRGPVLDVEQLGRVMELMEKHGVNVVDVRTGEGRIRIRRGFRPAASGVAPMMAPMSVAAAPAAAASPAPAATPPSSQSSAPLEDGPHIVYIKSPMVGTFYSRPKPDAEAYVKVGGRVGPDTTVCIIEAMKTFNEIPAGVSGVIVSVLAKNEEPVDYDRPLFKVDTSR